MEKELDKAVAENTRYAFERRARAVSDARRGDKLGAERLNEQSVALPPRAPFRPLAARRLRHRRCGRRRRGAQVRQRARPRVDGWF
jgi:hypothetical protein